jgi:hypothetical protein
MALVSGLLVLTACAAAPTTTGDDDGDAPAEVSDSAQWSYAQSLRVTAAPDLPRPTLAGCAARPVTPAQVIADNARTGDGSWRPADLVARPRVPLYLDRESALCGTTVVAHLGGAPRPQVTVRAYRIGWYSGAGARLVWTSAPVDVAPDQGAARTGATLPSPGWPTQVTIPVDSAWLPGEYLLETWDRSGLAGVAPFVVRDDAGQGGVVVVHSSLTWAAYSRFQDSSLYRGRGGEGRALTTSLQRPLTGDGLVNLMAYDVPLTQFMEQHGLAARHVLDTDLDAWPSLARDADCLVLAGHSEYWTRRMYDAALAARNDGTNIADLGANEVYWQARLDRAADGTPLAMTVARTLAQDPLAATSPESATVRWTDPPLLRDGSALIGQRFSALKVDGSVQVWSLPDWLVVGTGLQVGDVLPHLVQNEADGLRPGSAATPPDLQTVLMGVLHQAGRRDQPVSTTYYTAPSGAAVFSAGTTFWTCDLTDSCPTTGTPPAVAAVVRALTLDVLRGFAHRGFGAAHPSSPDAPTSVADAVARLSPAATGTYGS